MLLSCFCHGECGAGARLLLKVGQRIRSLRKRRKMSQETPAKSVGVTFQQVQKYENGRNRVGASRLQLVADALAVPIVELLNNEPESRPAKLSSCRQMNVPLIGVPPD
jgi:transcriptional regulator with XRE-family HTH domain